MRLDINFATAFRLQSLTGVGLKKAETIVQYRQKIGGFDSVDSLCDVPGIGASIVEQNRQVLTCKKLKSQPSRIRHTKSAPSVDVSKLGRRERRGQLATDSTVKNSATAAPGTSNKKSPVTSTRRKRFSETDVPTRVTRSRIKALPHDDLNSHFTGLIKSTVSTHGSSRHVVDGPNVGTDSQDPVISPVDDSNQSHDLPTKGNNSSSPVESESRNIKERRGRITSHDVSSLPNPTVQPESPADEDDDEEEEEEMEREEEEEEERWMDVNEEGCSDEEEDGERCVRCCCNHVRLTSSSHSSHKYHQSKRKSSCKDESYGGKRLCRHPCHSCMSCGHRPSALPPWRHSLCRQRIPSKENPPPGLSTWIDTFKTWSNAERLMALDEMIGVCELTQVRHMMQVIEPQFQRDFISLLPKELALHVLSFLEPRDLLQAAQTCHYWHTLTEDNLLWREKCREENIDRSSFSKRKSATNCSPWKTLYLRQYQIEQNWRSGGIRPNKVLKGHDDHVITCLEYCNNKIISGSDDNTLKVWSAITGKCLRTLVGHTGGVWSSQMVGNTIISGSTDRTLRVWNADTGQCQHVLYGHSSTVRCMSLHVNRVVSGSRDATLRMWDIETGDCLHVLVGHVAAVRCVQYDGRRVVSGAYDYTVRVWDPDTETCVHTLQGHTNRVYSLQFDGAHIVSGSLDTSIRVWDVESGNCLHTLIGHQSLTSGLELKDNILVSGNADSTVKVWDITSGHCLQTLQGPHKHQSAVTCLQFSKKFVITSSDDGTVKIWDLKTGDFLRNLVSLESGGSGGVVWRLRCSNTKLVCAVGSRNGTEETKLLVLDFDVDDKKL